MHCRILRTLFTLTCEIAIIGTYSIALPLLCVRGASWLHFESGKGKKYMEKSIEKVLNFAYKNVYEPCIT